ncbi:MAG TPA: glycosyl hydrolase [Armatimonadota bacterium]|jgi:hypothetical protein
MTLTCLQHFATPGAAYRGKPFWAWNGALDPEELRRQIRLMHQMGLGGFFMHARVGLDTAYLSEDWFRCVDACIDEAATLGMEAWLYDEDRWPSGAAGGLVTKNPDYRARKLIVHILTDPQELSWDDTLAAFSAVVDGAVARDVAPLARDARPVLRPDQVILRFAVQTEDTSPWYNGQTYLDTLSHDAVREFLRVTHEAYAEHCGEHFGGMVPGIFTDEPSYGDMLPTEDTLSLPWTASLLTAFATRYGYDLLPHLVELYFDIAGQPVSQARYHYHDCVTYLFVDAFARQIGEWCAEHQLLFTGHVLEEDTLRNQVNRVGSCMRFYEHMQAPGMDLLTEHWRVFGTAKQVSSAARQFGRDWRLSETYGCTGWDFPFAGHKALGDWQVALGINLRCQHLAWYTMQGEAKRDYPASISYQSPWWDTYHTVEDYFARILAVMTRGVEVRDLLVIHPVESMWLQCKRGWKVDAEVTRQDQQFLTLTEALLAGHIDFDYGDEELLSRHANVRLVNGIPECVVGEAVYHAMLVPPLTTIRASTLSLLAQFRELGGTVVFLEEPPQYVDAQPSAAAITLAAQCRQGLPVHGPALLDAVAPTCRRLSITDAHGEELAPVLYLLREDADACYLFICNTGEDFVRDGRGLMDDPLVRERTLAFPEVIIRGFAPCAGTPLQLDPETGATNSADALRTDAGWEIRTSLPALGSRLFVLPKTAMADAAVAPLPTRVPAQITTLEEATRPIQLSEPNVLVLDYPQYRLADGDWQEATEILQVDQAVRRALGIAPRGGAMVQPWAREYPACPQRIAVALRYEFDVAELPGGELFLACETPETLQITLNGVALVVDVASGWWTDRSLRKIPVHPALLRRGHNVLTVTCDYAETHSGLEIIYLLGDFGVTLHERQATLTALPTHLALGDWCMQGLPFYAGSVLYAQEVELPPLAAGARIAVQVPDYRGVGVRVWVAGHPAGTIGWEPNEVDVTDLVMGNAHALLQIEVLGHRRNSHGPLHLKEKWPTWTGPGQFLPSQDEYYPGYQLVPCGLMAQVQLVTYLPG